VCTFTVTVLDAEPPQIICPTNILVVVPFGGTNAVVTFSDPVVTDNCSVSWTQCSISSGSVFPIGATIVSCQAADMAGNTNACSFTVTVNAEPPPEADLAIFKSVSSVSNEVGSEITYTLTATNLGPDAATGMVIFSQVPPGMEFSSAPDGIFTNGAVVFAVPDLPSGAGTNYAMVLIPNNAGLLTNTTTISSEVIDPYLPNNTARAVVTVRTFQVLDLRVSVSSSMTLNRQTGLMEQSIQLTNAGNVTVSGARIYLCGLPSQTVYNASGYDTNGCAYVDYLSALGPGEAVTLNMEYYLRLPVPDPELSVEVIEPPAPPVITRIEVLAEGSVQLEFTSVPGHTYTVQYSDDGLQTWKNAVPPISAAGNRVQWIDDGPPKTDAHPESLNSRMYRVLLNNN
jgi:uncharacterized repeat protein (TIGR01451 family)